MQPVTSVLGVIAVLSFVLAAIAEMGDGAAEHSINQAERGNRHSSENNIANKAINATSRRMSDEIGYESSTVYREFKALEEGTRANLVERLGEIQKDRDSNLTRGMEIGTTKEESDPSQESLPGLSIKNLRKKAELGSMMKNHSLLESLLESPLGKSLDLSSYEAGRVALVVSSRSDVDESSGEEAGLKPNSFVKTNTKDQVEEGKFQDQSYRRPELTFSGFIDKQTSTENSLADGKSSTGGKTVPAEVLASGYAPFLPERNATEIKDEEGKVSYDKKERLDSTEHQSTRKNQGSKSQNEFLNGKSGSFREIKSSKVINIHRQTNQLILSGKIVQPKISSPLGKYTPYFEDGDEEQNVTARIGNTVLLDCKIGMLGNKTVTWSYHSPDVIRLLTVGRMVYSLDERISLFFRYPTNWRLRIQYALPRDSGLYECQVATYPQPLVKKINLLVTAPILVIMDDSGRIKSGERHLKAGSALRLRCEARDVLEQHNETVIWTRGDETLTEDVVENKTTEIFEGREIQVIVSTIVVERAASKHAGNYSCMVPEKAKTTVAVHVLNGELPAAVHDGSGVSRSVLNLWLIHLTVSYVFTR